MHEFADVDIPLLLQGKTTTFCNFMLELLDQSGVCSMLNADYTTTEKPKMMICSKDHDQAEYNWAKEFNSLIP